jgi:HSP20 family protein
VSRPTSTLLEARDPLTELNRLVGEIDSVLDRAFASLGRPSFTSLPNGAFTTLADIEETEDAYVIEIELPGIKREDASVEVQGRRIVVTGERKEIERTGIFRTKTRVTGRFRYEALLPGDIDADQVAASYQDGLLVVRAPKPESKRAKVRKIEVK